MRVPVLLSLAFALASAAPAPPASSAEVERAAGRLQEACNRTVSLEASFVQVLHSVALARPQEERGRLLLLRPGRMRWEYSEPERKIAVLDGQRSWLYVPAENQVFVGSLEEARRSGAAGLLLAGNVDLRRDFLLQPGPEPRGGGALSLTLVPRRPEGEFERLDVTLDPATGLPARIAVHLPLGDVMEYRFADLRPGVPLDAALFRFQPPPGTEVVLAE